MLKKIRILMSNAKRDSGKRLLYTHMRRVVTKKFGTKVFAVSLYKRTQRKATPGAVVVGKGYVETADEVGEYYTLDAREQHQDSKEKDKNEAQTFYFDIRLPEEAAVLKYYLLSGTLLTVDEDTGLINCLKLIRLKVKVGAVHPRPNTYAAAALVPIDGMGCNLKIQFLLDRYPGHLCKVYKRYRYQDPENKERIVKDWKIKVVQLDGAKSEDYIVVRRLPCTLSDVEGILQQTLDVQHNRRIVPNTILHLFWKIFDIVIYSQKFYDFTQPRFAYQHVNTYYFSQSVAANRRIPEPHTLESKFYDPLYEVYI